MLAEGVRNELRFTGRDRFTPGVQRNTAQAVLATIFEHQRNGFDLTAPARARTCASRSAA